MKASVLHRLAAAADLAVDDITGNGIRLDFGVCDADWRDDPENDGRIAIAWFASPYLACRIQIPCADKVGSDVTVDPADFKAVTSLFSADEDVTLGTTASSLTLRSKRRRTSLRFSTLLPPEPTADLDALQPHVQVETKALAAEALAASRVTATSLAQPMITGIRLFTVGTKLGLQSLDGTSMYFEAALGAGVYEPFFAETEPPCILPPSELVKATKLLKGEHTTLTRLGGHVYLSSDDCIIKLPCIIAQGTWPSPMKLRVAPYDDALTLDTARIKTIVSALRVVKGSFSATLAPSEGGVVVQSADTDRGQHEEALDGTLQRSYWFTLDHFDRMSQVADGEITLKLSPTTAMMVAGNRRLYMTTRIVP